MIGLWSLLEPRPDSPKAARLSETAEYLVRHGSLSRAGNAAENCDVTTPQPHVLVQTNNAGGICWIERRFWQLAHAVEARHGVPLRPLDSRLHAARLVGAQSADKIGAALGVG